MIEDKRVGADWFKSAQNFYIEQESKYQDRIDQTLTILTCLLLMVSVAISQPTSFLGDIILIMTTAFFTTTLLSVIWGMYFSTKAYKQFRQQLTERYSDAVDGKDLVWKNTYTPKVDFLNSLALWSFTSGLVALLVYALMYLI